MKKVSIQAPENTAVIYARYSSRNQREESLGAQIRACKAYAVQMGYLVVAIYTDSAKSGTNAERENFQRMIEDSARGSFRYLIIHKLDRFSRSKKDSVNYKDILRKNGVTIKSVLERLDDSPESVVMESMLEGWNQYYSMNLSREVKKGMIESAYQCTHLGGIPPLGYNVDPVTKTYVINEQEAAIVRTIFGQYTNGIGYNRILGHLNGMGYRTKRGNMFGKNSLNSILKNEKYAGIFTFNKIREKDACNERSPQLRPREEWIIVEEGMPIIIDRETFDKAQAKMRENKRNGGSFKAKANYLLSGLVFCGNCGASMHGDTRPCGRNKTKYSSYRCPNRRSHKLCSNKEVRKSYIEEYVLDELYFKLFADTSIQRLAKMLSEYTQKKSTESGAELQKAKDGLGCVTQKIGKVVRLVSESGISIDTVKDELKLLEEQKVFFERKISDLSAPKVNMISEEKILELISRSRDFVKSRNIPECRRFIKNFLEKVVIYGERVELLFKIHIPDNNGASVKQLKSGEGVDTIKADYKSGNTYMDIIHHSKNHSSVSDTIEVR